MEPRHWTFPSELVLPVVHGEKACCTRLVDVGVRLGTYTALEKVNLHVHCGELTAIIGPNGAGKTTLLKTIMGELSHSGQLVFLPSSSAAGAQRPKVGYVPQRMELDKTAPVTVLDLFAASRTRRPLWAGCSRRVRSEARDALDTVGAGDLLKRRLGELSGGQLQRVLLALALTPVPQLLLLDEPLAGVDRAGMAQFYETVSGLRRTMDLSILFVSHDLMAAAAIADRMVLIHNRTILLDGVPADVMSKSVVRETFGLDVEIPYERLGVPNTCLQCPAPPERPA